MLSPEKIVESADRRPGFRVVTYREIGLPVFSMKPLVTIQEHSEIGPIEEYVLRSIDLGISRSPDIASYLGLPDKIVNHQLGTLAYENMVAKIVETLDTYSLTPSGLTRLKEKGRKCIEKEVLPIVVDGITRQVLPNTSDSFLRNRDLGDMGLDPLPPIPRAAPRGDELDVAGINHALEMFSLNSRIDKKVIQVEALIGRNYLLFRPALAIAFKSDNGRSVSIGFAIDGVMSEAHERHYMRGDDARKSAIFGNIFDSGKRRKEVQHVARELREDVNIELVGFRTQSANNGRRKTLSLKKRTLAGTQDTQNQDSVRPISVYEHPGILENALNSASQRVLIISPWIRRKVVGKTFLGNLRRCLERGVEVTIAYGIDRDDKNANYHDKKAEADLVHLSKGYTNFRLMRKGNTHAKVLIKDSEFYVTTSFNWLSFKGDPSQPFREEEGTYVEGRKRVDEYYNRLMQRINEHPMT